MVIGGIRIGRNDTSGTVRDLGLSGERYVGVMTIRRNKTSGFSERWIKSLSVNWDFGWMRLRDFVPVGYSDFGGLTRSKFWDLGGLTASPYRQIALLEIIDWTRFRTIQGKVFSIDFNCVSNSIIRLQSRMWPQCGHVRFFTSCRVTSTTFRHFDFF